MRPRISSAVLAVLFLLFSVTGCHSGDILPDPAAVSEAGLADGAASISKDEGPISVRAVFIGDIMVHDPQLEVAKIGGLWDFWPQVGRVAPLLADSLAVGNLETVLGGNEGKIYAGYPSFNTPDELATALVDLEIDIVTLANNHILDHGLDAARRTTTVLDASGIAWTGLSPQDDLYAPLLFEYGGLKWAFVNYTYGSNAERRLSKPEDLQLNIISEAAILTGLERAAAYEPDITIAFLHWGAEYHLAPSTGQRNTAALCLENGADIVIGTHPHVLQPIEVVSSADGHGVVVYSLGNFVSSQRTKPRERSVILAIDIEKEPGERAAISRVSVAPTWVSFRWEGNERKIEVLYAGRGGGLEQADLPAAELSAARRNGAAVLDFLGASINPAPDGFYTLWDAWSPNLLPVSRRAQPE